MKCTVVSAVVFVILSLIYGTAFAGVAQGMKYFQPCVMIAYRMLYGFLACVIVFVIRLLAQKQYKQVALAHFTSGAWPFIHMTLAGLMFHAITQCMIAVALTWVPSAAAQVVQPLSSATSAIMSHFVTDDEKFTVSKGISLVFALVGVVTNAVPPFLKPTDSSGTKNTAIGYALLVISMIVQGVGMVWMKWKTPNADVTVSTMIQVGMSAIASFLWVLIWDSPATLAKESTQSPPIAWVWPILVGVLGTGLAGHGFVFLVGSLGSTGASFITFGQIFVGIIVSVAFLKEWAGYRWWEILISVLGLVALAGAIFVGLILDSIRAKGQKMAETHEDEEEEATVEKVEEVAPGPDGAMELEDINEAGEHHITEL